MTYSRLSIISKSSAILAVCAGLWPSLAHGARVANFSAAAANQIVTSRVKEATESNCIITVQNVSDSPQRVTFSIKLFAQASGGTCTVNGGAASCSGTGSDNQHGATLTNASFGLADPLILAPSTASVSAANCANGVSSTCTLPMTGTSMTFPVISELQAGAVTQNVRCEGKITVDNCASGDAGCTPGQPGYIVASGNLSTFVEAVGGVALTFDLANNSNGTGKNNTTTPSNTTITIGEGRPF